MIERIYNLSYYHHQIRRMNYSPLFKGRLWNNGMRYMSNYILLRYLEMSWSHMGYNVYIDLEKALSFIVFIMKQIDKTANILHNYHLVWQGTSFAFAFEASSCWSGMEGVRKITMRECILRVQNMNKSDVSQCEQYLDVNTIPLNYHNVCTTSILRDKRTWQLRKRSSTLAIWWAWERSRHLVLDKWYRKSEIQI